MGCLHASRRGGDAQGVFLRARLERKARALLRYQSHRRHHRFRRAPRRHREPGLERRRDRHRRRRDPAALSHEGSAGAAYLWRRGAQDRPATGAMLSVLTITDAAHLRSLRAPWEQLAERSGTDDVTLHPSWMLSWWDVFGGDDGRELRTFAFYD